MDYVNFFYTNYVGKHIKNKHKITEQTIQHILDCIKGEKNHDILLDIFEICSSKGYISINQIPQTVWKDTLVTANAFYYHPELQIKPCMPVFDYGEGINRVPVFFLEIRKQYTMNNLLSYAYDKLHIPEYLQDAKRDIGSIEYLAKRYKNNGITSWLDFILYLIDTAANSKMNIRQIIKLSDFEADAAEKVKQIVSIAKAKGFDKPKYRWEVQ